MFTLHYEFSNRGDLAPTSIRERERLEVDVAVTSIPQSDVAATTIRERERLEVDVAVTPIPQSDVAATTISELSGDEVVVAHAAVAQDFSSRPSHPSTFTQTGSLMLRTYAFEDTRSGYNDDDDFE